MDSLKSHGKCILLGEHTVLRGGRALVFPLPLSLNLEWKKSQEPLRIEDLSPNAENEPLDTPVRLAIAAALSKLKHTPQLQMTIQIRNNIPTKAGLGSSAALTVSLAKMFKAEGMLETSDVFALALEMENVFHGKSSGLDVAAVLSENPILFEREKPSTPLHLSWKPHLYVSDSGVRSSTKDCIAKVAKHGKENIDSKMKHAVEMAHDALSNHSLLNLASSISKGEACFQDWNLIPSSVSIRIAELKTHGALAVKPTGSGDGGFILSLWETQPSPQLLKKLALIPVI